MTAWMIMMIVAAGPLFALADSFDDPGDAEEDDDFVAPEPDTDTTDGQGEGETDGDAGVDADPGAEGDLAGDAEGDAPADGDAEADPTAPAAINELTLTSDDDIFEGTDDARQFIDLGAGNDVATGARLADILQGGVGADTISGGGGGDMIYATDANAAGASDGDIDVLDGGAGSDFLYFANGDLATGGTGGDTFVLRQDLDGNATITDFDEAADSIIFETPDPDALSVTSQTITDAGVVVTLSNGATLTLQNVNAPINEAQITFSPVQALT